MSTGRPPLQAGDEDRLTTLSLWDQTSMRTYNRVVLCFPLHGSRPGRVVDAIRGTLDRLARQHPQFAGCLELDETTTPARVRLRESAGDRIPLDTSHIEDTFGHTYEQLRAAGFPSRPLVHPRFAVSGALAGRPRVVRVHAFFVRAGLLLAVYSHHALVDGSGLRLLLECFSGQTRHEARACPSRLDLSLPEEEEDGEENGDGAGDGATPTFDDLLARCPEFAPLADLSGPTQPALHPGGPPLSAIAKTGRIFVFPAARLRALQALLRRHSHSSPTPTPTPTSTSTSNPTSPHHPTTYTALAALTWARTARARLLAERAPAHRPAGLPTAQARLINPVDWRPRAPAAWSAGYLGNAVALAHTGLPTALLVAACASPRALARVADAVADAVAAVGRRGRWEGEDEDEDGDGRGAFVRRRSALFARAPDPRALGVAVDPRAPQCLAFNTWRRLGADTVWSLPGCGGGEAEGVRPDAVRRAQDVCNMGGALILPARADAEELELLVTLPECSMEALCADEGWLEWVRMVRD